MTNDRDKAQRIIQLAHDVLTAEYSEDAERALYTLAMIDLAAAAAIGLVMSQAFPPSKPLWNAVLDQAYAHDRQHKRTRAYELGINPPKPFDWGQDDSKDTANDLSNRMGWRDMEKQQ